MTLTPTCTEAMTRYLIEKTRAGLESLGQVLEVVPDERLDEQPVPDQMPVGKMIEHAYGAAAFTARSIRLGRCDETDIADLKMDEADTGTRLRIEEVAAIAAAEISATLAELDEQVATRTIEYWFGWSLTGLDTAALGLQEVTHHRGQIQSFLRLMGYDPPDIYAPADVSEGAVAE